MTTRLPDHVLREVSEVVAAHLGLNFPPERWRDLERGLERAARELALADAAALAQILAAPTATALPLEALASALTIGETYFFREAQSFELLRQSILPELFARRRAERRLRLWSAGCCTGEEPYSLAILLSQLLPDLPQWNLTLLATDLNRRFLERAALGVYGEWSFRRTADSFKAQYFTHTPEGRYELRASIRKLVSFAYLNLALDPFPSLLNNTNAMDVIFCRNVLMYFDAEHAHKVVQGFHRALADDGWLIVSPSEASHVLFAQFEAIHYPDVILYRKTAHRAAGASPAPVTVRQPTPPPLTIHPPLTPVPVPAPKTPTGPLREDRNPAAPPTSATARPPEPQTPENWGRLARQAANQGRLEEALDWCQRALTADRLNPAWHYLEATIQTERGTDEAASQALKRALYLDPAFVLAHYALGQLARRQGRADAAARHFTNALDLLATQARDAVLPEADGLTAGRLSELIRATLDQPLVAI